MSTICRAPLPHQRLGDRSADAGGAARNDGLLPLQHVAPPREGGLQGSFPASHGYDFALEQR